MLPMHVWLSDGQNSPICTTFPEIKCVFISLRVKCVLRHFLVHRFSLPRYTFMCAWHVTAYAEAQCCFKSFTLRSCQCGRKTRYGLEFWSLGLPSAPVNFLGRVPALMRRVIHEERHLDLGIGTFKIFGVYISLTKAILEKIFKGEMFIRTLFTILLQIFCKVRLNFNDIFKSNTGPDDYYQEYIMAQSTCQSI